MGFWISEYEWCEGEWIEPKPLEAPPMHIFYEQSFVTTPADKQGKIKLVTLFKRLRDESISVALREL